MKCLSKITDIVCVLFKNLRFCVYYLFICLLTENSVNNYVNNKNDIAIHIWCTSLSRNFTCVPIIANDNVTANCYNDIHINTCAIQTSFVKL